METFEIVVAPLGVEQVNGAPFPVGGVMVKLMAPVGCIAPEIPVTVAVNVVVPPRVGLAEATKVIIGVCWANVTVAAVIDLLL